MFILKHKYTFWYSPRTSCPDGMWEYKFSDAGLRRHSGASSSGRVIELKHELHPVHLHPGPSSPATRPHTLHLVWVRLNLNTWSSPSPCPSRAPHGFSRDTRGRSRGLPQPPHRPGDRSCPGEHHPGSQHLDPSTSPPRPGSQHLDPSTSPPRPGSPTVDLSIWHEINLFLPFTISNTVSMIFIMVSLILFSITQILCLYCARLRIRRPFFFQKPFYWIQTSSGFTRH